jgi:hypothetical protein
MKDNDLYDDDDFRRQWVDREQLIIVLTEIIEAHRAVAGLAPVVIEAERALDKLKDYSEQWEIPIELEVRQMERWTEVTGTEPPYR